MLKCNFTHSIIETIQIWSIYGQQFRILEKVGGTKFWLQKPRYREVRVIERRVIERSDCIYDKWIFVFISFILLLMFLQTFAKK